MKKTGKNSTYKFVKIETSGGQHSCPEWNKSVIPPVSMIVITEVVFIVRSCIYNCLSAHCILFKKKNQETLILRLLFQYVILPCDKALDSQTGIRGNGKAILIVISMKLVSWC